MTKKKRIRRSYHDGAQAERKSILRFLTSSRCYNMAALDIWIRNRVKRYRKRKGGL